MKLFKPFEIGRLTVREMRREYSRLRKEAKRRLQVLKRRNYLTYIDSVPDITQARGRSDMEVYQELRELNHFLNNPFTSIKYVNKFENNMIRELRSQGYYNINKSNIRAYNEYMAELKKMYGAVEFDSLRVTEAFDEIQHLNFDINKEVLSGSERDVDKKVEYLIENMEHLKNIKPVKGNKPMTMRELKKRITQWKNARR